VSPVSSNIKNRPKKACVKFVDDEVVHSPIIFTGRGGSGTRLLTQLAADLDIFLGNELNKTGDSLEWVDLIYKLTSDITSSSPAGWHGAEIKREALLENARITLGEGNWLPNQLWGWKLPESMLVLSLLLESFKHSRLVHLVRHPVTSSIRRSHRTSRAINPIGKTVLTAAYQSAGLDTDRIDSDPDYWRNAVTWLYQVETVANIAGTALPSSRYLQLRYEDICSDPGSEKKRLAGFLTRENKSIKFGNCSVLIEPDRVTPIDTEDERTIQVWDLCGKVAMELGYSREGAPEGVTG